MVARYYLQSEMYNVNKTCIEYADNTRVETISNLGEINSFSMKISSLKMIPEVYFKNALQNKPLRITRRFYSTNLQIFFFALKNNKNTSWFATIEINSGSVHFAKNWFMIFQIEHLQNSRIISTQLFTSLLQLIEFEYIISKKDTN